MIVMSHCIDFRGGPLEYYCIRARNKNEEEKDEKMLYSHEITKVAIIQLQKGRTNHNNFL